MKYALIGCGRIAAKHLKAAVDNGLEVVALCDADPVRPGELASRTGLVSGFAVYSDCRRMLDEHPELELVAVATDSGRHAGIALECIDRGINVIVEKPIALSLEDADAIIGLAAKRRVKVAVCHQNRFNTSVARLRTAIDRGSFGRLSHGAVCVRWNRDRSYYRQADWRGKWASDGGCLMNQCIHGIDMLRWMMGGRVTEVCGRISRRFHGYNEGEDVGMAVLRFADGSLGSIEGTVNVYPRNLEETLSVFGEKGTAKLGGVAMNTIAEWRVEGDADASGVGEEIGNVYGNGHSRLYADMLAAIAEDRPPYVDAVAGREALELVLAVYLSSKSGAPVRLPLSRGSSAELEGIFD